jgi:hypothetical protein
MAESCDRCRNGKPVVRNERPLGYVQCKFAEVGQWFAAGPCRFTPSRFAQC